MEPFKFSKLAIDSAKEGLIVVVIFVIIAGYILYRLSGKPEGLASKQSLIICGFLVLFGAVMLKSVYARFQSSGAWEITIDEQFLRWEAPPSLGQSFDVALREIKLFKVVSDDVANYQSYELQLHNGDAIELQDDMGMDFEVFMGALKTRGVEIEIEELISE